MSGRSSGCWPRRTTASVGGGTGSTRPAMPTPTASRKTSRATSGCIAIGWSAALNRDLPYDQFIVEQLAGDQLPGATQDQIVATGFLRNSMLNEEGGIDPEQFRMEAMFDRMDALGKSVLGLTIQCCQCHNHKFDPLTQEDYYRLFAFLNNDHEPQVTVYTPEEMIVRDALLREMRRDRSGAASTPRPTGPQRMAAWESEVTASQPEWEVLAPETYRDVGGGAKLSLLADQSMLCAGYAPTHCTFRVVGQDEADEDHGRAARTADRSELAARRAGPLVQGHLRADAISRSKPAPTGERRKARPSSRSPRPRPTSSSRVAAGAELRRSLGQEARSSGRSRSPSTARTKRPGASTPGPGRRNQDRKAVFRLEKPIEFAGRRGADDFARAEPRRLEQRRSSEQPAGPVSRVGHVGRRRPCRPIRCRARVREILAIPRERAHAGADGRSVPLLAHDRARVEARPTSRSRRCGSSGPRARRRWCWRPATMPRETRMLQAGRFSQAGRRGRRRACQPCCIRCPPMRRRRG